MDDWWKALEVQPVPVKAYRNGNRRRAGELDQGQRPLFSWAEFRTEEPVKRNDKPHSASTSDIQTRTECVHRQSTKHKSHALDTDAGFVATEGLGSLLGYKAAISVQTADQPVSRQRRTLDTTTARKLRSHVEIGGVREVMEAQTAQLEKDGRDEPEWDGNENEPAELHPPRRAYGLPDPGVVTLEQQPDEAHAFGPAAGSKASGRSVSSSCAGR